VPYYYDSIYADAFWHAGSGTWNFSQWVPNLVVIFLGINDFSTGFPGDNAYITGYHNLITRVLGHYPSASILCIQSHNTVSTSSEDADINQVVAAETTTLNHKKVYAVGTPTNLAVTSCNWHPPLADQKSMANAFLAKIMNIMSWDTATSIGNVARYEAVRRGSEVRIVSADSRGVVAHISSTVFPTSIAVMDVSGKCLIRNTIARDQMFRWNAENIPVGMFLIGNNDIGWTRFAVRSH
jgi:hypothetical protein